MSGVFLRRQYGEFAGIARGEATRRFSARLVQLKLATAYPFARGAHFLHLHNRKVYERIGEPDTRLRKRGNVLKAIERLLVLDAVIAKPDLLWLATERERVDHFIRRHALSLSDLPPLSFGSAPDQTRRFFPERRPIGVGPLGAITVMYPIVEPTASLFRTFLESHRRLLKKLTQWRVLLVIHRSLRSAERATARSRRSGA